jgi:glycopeptide antibiotics resistance protein
VVAATTAGIEASQGLVLVLVLVLVGHDCSVADVLANTVGGLAGIAVAVTTARVGVVVRARRVSR